MPRLQVAADGHTLVGEEGGNGPETPGVARPNKANQKTRSLTEFVDVFPTRCELTGTKTPDALAGKSLVPILRKPAGRLTTYAVSQYPRNGDKVMGYAIRTDRYRYVAWFEGNCRKNPILADAQPIATELYDYEKDPDETTNVAGDAPNRAVVVQHARWLREFLQNQSRPVAGRKPKN